MKKLLGLLNILLLTLVASAAFADSTISGLSVGGFVQPQDYAPVYRSSSPGTNFRVQFGSAAAQNIGTSGATIGLLNTANVYSNVQSFLTGDLTAADPVFTGGSILLPVGTTGDRPSSPLNGMIRYNTSTPGLEAYSGGVWGPIAGGSAGITGLTGDGTASGTGSVAFTLATVNSNVGTFGAASTVPQITTDGKGRITGVASVTITPSAIGAPTTTGTGASGNWGINITGNAATATALAATPTLCPTGQAPTGILANGNATACAVIGGGSVSSVFGRTGAITAQTGDYIVSQITGAAPLASPTFTGTVTLPAGQVVNGVTLNSAGSSSLFLTQAGTYASAGGGGSISLTAATPDMVVTPNPITGTGTIGTFGLTNFKTKLHNVTHGTGNALLCATGDSTTIGEWSLNSGSGDQVANSYPTKLSDYLNSTHGIRSNWNGFLGYGSTAFGGYGTGDARVIIGGWALDGSIVSIGGDTYKTTTVAGTALTFTPATNLGNTSNQFTDFDFAYIQTPGAGTLSVQVDSGTPATFNTAGTAALVKQHISGLTLGTHTIKFTMSAGTQVNLVGVVDAYDNTQGWVNVVGAGWPGSKSTDWSPATNAYSPGNPAAWTALGCDANLIQLGINDWANGGSLGAYGPAMQTLISAMPATTDVVLESPVPSITSAATQATQLGYVAEMYTLANTNKLPLYDVFTRWQNYVTSNALGLYASGGSGLHPVAKGYQDEATAIAEAISSSVATLDNPLGFIASSSSSSQWTTSGSNLYYTTGAVSIGTTAPVASNQLTTSQSYANEAGVLAINTSSGVNSGAQVAAQNDIGVQVGIEALSSGFASGLANHGVFYANGYLGFLSDNTVATSGTDPIDFTAGGFSRAVAMRISAGSPGAVSIGTTTPVGSAELTVSGGAAISGLGTFATVNIGSTAAATTGSVLDLSSANTSMILPTGTTVQRPTPTAGMLRYNSTTPGIEAYYSSAWNAIGTGGGSVSVTAATPDVVIAPTPGTGTFTVGTTQIINNQAGQTAYTVLSSDMGKTILFNDASAVATTLPQAGTTGFALGTSFAALNTGAGSVTITPTTSTINGQTTLVIPQYQGAYIISDGTNWYSLNGVLTGGAGTVTTYSCVTANGVSCSVANPTTTPAATFTLGAITPSSVTASGVMATGANSGTGGQVTFNGATSGSVAVNVPAAAGTSTNFTLPSSNGTNGFVLTTNGSGVTSWTNPAGGGTVTSVSVVTANGVSGSVATSTTTPAITLTLGAITPSTVYATGAVVGAENTPTISTATFATNAALGDHFRIALSSACPCTLSNPTNPTDGQKITYELVQDGTGSRTIGTYGTAFTFGTTGAPTLTTTASKRDLIGFVYSADESKWLFLGSQLGF